MIHVVQAVFYISGWCIWQPGCVTPSHYRLLHFELESALAIKLGKATIACFWGAYLDLEITEQLTVHITYESPEWAAESNRLKAKATSVF